jgi:hypothetical protein
MSRIQITLLISLLLFSEIIALAQNSKQELNDQLWEAARSGDATLVTALLDKGADVNARFRYGATALFKAAERGHIEVVKVLVARGADVTVKDTFYGATAMTWALDHKHLPVIQALLEKDSASVSDVLMTGVNEANIDLVSAALQKGGLKGETLTAALAAADQNKDAAAIAQMLKKAGALPPLQVPAATLESYVGSYKSSDGRQLVLRVQDGKLFADFGGRPFALIALANTVFRPVEFEGLTLEFAAEAETVKSVTLKQANSSNVFMRVVPTKP